MFFPVGIVSNRIPNKGGYAVPCTFRVFLDDGFASLDHACGELDGVEFPSRHVFAPMQAHISNYLTFMNGQSPESESEETFGCASIPRDNS